MIATLSPWELLMWLSLCVLFLFLSGVYSGAETGLYCLNRLRLRLAAHRQEPTARRLQTLMEDQPSLLVTTLLGTNLANYLAPACLTVVFLRTLAETPGGERLAEAYTTLILTPVVFIFGEIVPKNLFQRHANRFMPRLAAFLAGSQRLFAATGLVGVQRWLSQFVARKWHLSPASGAALYSRHGLYQMLHEGAAAGAMSRTQVFILERVHLLQSIVLGSVMAPWQRVVTLRSTDTRREAEAALRAGPYARFPVVGNDPRRVVGIVHLLDLLTASPGDRAAEVMRPALELRPELPVVEALSTLQREHRRMAVIVDKWGNAVGIVTVKDLVEEIVGELAAW